VQPTYYGWKCAGELVIAQTQVCKGSALKQCQGKLRIKTIVAQVQIRKMAKPAYFSTQRSSQLIPIQEQDLPTGIWLRAHA
jgi:hypothetical protein